jgi:hypothetical protein
MRTEAARDTAARDTVARDTAETVETEPLPETLVLIENQTEFELAYEVCFKGDFAMTGRTVIVTITRATRTES